MVVRGQTKTRQGHAGGGRAAKASQYDNSAHNKGAFLCAGQQVILTLCSFVIICRADLMNVQQIAYFTCMSTSEAPASLVPQLSVV